MKKEKSIIFAWNRVNLIAFCIGVFLIILGMILMSGGAPENPEDFTPEKYNFQRITLSVILIIIGFITNIFAILYPLPKNTEEDSLQ